jgi:hypothetical protein
VCSAACSRISTSGQPAEPGNVRRARGVLLVYRYFTIAYKFSIAEMWLIWLGTLIGVRYGGQALFHMFSYHRGIWHSILAGVFFWFVTAIVFKHVLNLHEGIAWLAGRFLFIGYLTHLILDETYSVDVPIRGSRRPSAPR